MIKLEKKYDVIVVGAGVAGLNCALNISPEKSVLVICKDTPDKSDSYLAQGGICRLPDDADYQSYFDDTMRAGHYENNPASVDAMIRGSQEIIDDLIALGVDFARNADGSLAYTKEGGHSRPRICFHEDTTGREITTHLMSAARARSNIFIVPCVTMLDIICDGSRCYGIVAKDGKNGRLYRLYADYTVLASGGIGGIFENSTNFRVLTGDAVAVCLQHGIAVDHINYIQIHPTTLYSKKKGRRFLISESVRGEGAVLLDKHFKRFTDELKPRDIVTAAIREQMAKDGTDHVWLDALSQRRLRRAARVHTRCARPALLYGRHTFGCPRRHHHAGAVRRRRNLLQRRARQKPAGFQLAARKPAVCKARRTGYRRRLYAHRYCRGSCGGGCAGPFKIFQPFKTA